MHNPRLVVDLGKLAHNTRTIVALAADSGASVTGVVKGCCGDPAVGRAMLEGGVRALGDSRTANLARLQRALPESELWLLRIPMPSEVHEVARLADVVLLSEPAVARGLAAAAVGHARRLRVVMMVDVGDLREGVWPDRAGEVARHLDACPGLELVGIGTNLACYGGVIPDQENMARLIDARRAVEQAIGRPLAVISGGNSANLSQLLSGVAPPGVNNYRVGEGILLGREAVRRETVPGTYQDAFTLVAEVIEESVKPSVPLGCIGQDAFGRVPVFADRGRRRRAIFAVGRQDLLPEGVFPRADGASVLGASSDHLLVDVTDTGEAWPPGREMEFDIGYATLLRAMTSPYVFKYYR